MCTWIRRKGRYKRIVFVVWDKLKKKLFAYEIKETFNNWLWCLPFTRTKDNVRPLSIKEKDLLDVVYTYNRVERMKKQSEELLQRYFINLRCFLIWFLKFGNIAQQNKRNKNHNKVIIILKIRVFVCSSWSLSHWAGNITF